MRSRSASGGSRSLKLPELSLITVIEILSPSNKAGSGRADYVAKRDQLIDQDTINLVEIDLLLGWVTDADGPSASRRQTTTRSWPVRSGGLTPRSTHGPCTVPCRPSPSPCMPPTPTSHLRLAEVVTTAYEDGGFDA